MVNGKLRKNFLPTSVPFVSFKVFQFNSKLILLIVCKHVDILITEPELFSRISKSILVICPVTVEVFSGVSKVVTSLNNLLIATKSCVIIYRLPTISLSCIDYNPQNFTYGPTAVSYLLFTEDFQEPVCRSPDLEVVDTRVPHTGV